METEPQNDERHLFIHLDLIRRWDAGIYQRFPQPEKVPITGLEPGGPDSCDARVAEIYGSVLIEDGVFRMWYSVMPDALSHAENADHFYAAYAESDDGIHWRKPDLKITGQERFPGNNLLSLPGAVMGVVRALPGAEWKYLAAVTQLGLEKGVSEEFGYQDNGGGTYLYVSDDGLHWRQLTKEPVSQQGDVSCLFADPRSNRYLLYQKVGQFHGFDLRRSFVCMESKDGANWEGTETWRDSFVCDDYDDMQAMQAGFRIADHYGVAIYRAGDTYISVEDIFLMGDPLRLKYAQNPVGLYKFRLGFSRDGSHWRHPKGRPTWLEPDAPGEWGAGFGVSANTFVEHDDHLLLYYGASLYDHGWSIEEDFRLRTDIPLEEQRDTSRVILARIRKDRFASLSATYKGVIAVDSSRPAKADELFINALCPNGSIRVAFSPLEKQEEILPGFGFDDCIPFIGDETRAPVEFRNKKLSDLPDEDLMLHFEITRGEIFGFEWRQSQ